jgi:CRP/FNR family cyclic AMP-dependent transcriptional regulator
VSTIVNYLNNHPALKFFLHHCHIKNYSPKTTLIHIGDDNKKLFFIIKGSVIVGTVDQDDGRELIYAYLHQGQFIGEIGLFNATESRIVHIKTRCDCQVAEIAYDRFKQLLTSELKTDAFDILFMIGQQLSDRLIMTSRNFRDLAFMDVEGRIARTLLDLSKEPDAKIHQKGMQIRITRQELSQIVGCSREVAGRVLKELALKNLIIVQGKTIIVFNENV